MREVAVTVRLEQLKQDVRGRSMPYLSSWAGVESWLVEVQATRLRGKLAQDVVPWAGCTHWPDSLARKTAPRMMA